MKSTSSEKGSCMLPPSSGLFSTGSFLFGDDDQNQDHKLSATNCVAIDAASEDDRYSSEDGESFHDYSPNLVNMFRSFTLPELRRLQVDAVATPNWMSTVEKQWEQPLANSVCEFKSDEEPGTAIYTLSQKSEAEPFFSTYLPKLLLNPNNILKFRRTKRDKLHRSQKPHQVGKAREFKENKGKFWLLEKQYCREAQQITKLLQAESCVVSEEWTHLQRPIRDIRFEIGDAIMDDILKEMLSILVNN
ncbi:hypothetical protein QN277_001285 [Acacia crassicarpa]|uniref:DUF4378 domain-containing protein n=1 Tax=Acacia crassicarpa TaxID=499986 RepID=A0AAE1N742_9FABA|nr:hypothetical protein QN277_001285 [Acacia crassicarpa]